MGVATVSLDQRIRAKARELADKDVDKAFQQASSFGSNLYEQVKLFDQNDRRLRIDLDDDGKVTAVYARKDFLFDVLINLAKKDHRQRCEQQAVDKFIAEVEDLREQMDSLPQ